MTTDTSDCVAHCIKTNKRPTLFIVFGGLTVLFALLSMITGNRLSTLQANYQKALNETVASDIHTRKEMQIALKAKSSELIALKQALVQEKKKNNQLKKKFAVVSKEMKTIKTDLANANNMTTVFLED